VRNNGGKYQSTKVPKYQRRNGGMEERTRGIKGIMGKEKGGEETPPL